jgi:hypothetical protein
MLPCNIGIQLPTGTVAYPRRLNLQPHCCKTSKLTMGILFLRRNSECECRHFMVMLGMHQEQWRFFLVSTIIFVSVM